MYDNRKVAQGCMLIIGFESACTALAVSTGHIHGTAWGVAAWFLANGLFFSIIALKSMVER